MILSRITRAIRDPELPHTGAVNTGRAFGQ